MELTYKEKKSVQAIFDRIKPAKIHTKNTPYKDGMNMLIQGENLGVMKTLLDKFQL
jgi:hypothetical protein